MLGWLSQIFAAFKTCFLANNLLLINTPINVHAVAMKGHKQQMTGAKINSVLGM
jgi:hypothetical protein